MGNLIEATQKKTENRPVIEEDGSVSGSDQERVEKLEEELNPSKGSLNTNPRDFFGSQKTG